MDKSARAKALAAATAGHVFWGFSFIASRRALDTAHVFVLLSHRFVLALAVMSLAMPIFGAKLRLKGRRAWLLVLLGLLEPVVYFFGEQYGILHSSTIFSGVMIAMIPVAATLAALPVLHEKPTAAQIVFSLLSVAGVIGIGLITKSSGSLDLIGVIALVVAVLAAVGYTLLSRGLAKEYSPFDRTYMMLAVGAVVFTAFAMGVTRGNAAEYFAPFSDGYYCLSVGFLGVCCSVVSYFLASYAITNLTVAQTTVFANLTTAVSVFAGAVLLKEPFSWLGVLFCLLILIGIYGVQRAAKE
ncbi:MAG: DMT family transporter [Clostridia bacterium]|nr:DMT family transporter [Clostridia bacterium]